MHLLLRALPFAALAAAQSGPWPTSEPYWPHYVSRNVTVLSGVWASSAVQQGIDALTVPYAAISTPATMVVPGCTDIAPPGVVPNRGVAFFRSTHACTPGAPALASFGAVNMFARVFADGVEVGNSTNGYTPFELLLPPCGAAGAAEDLLDDASFGVGIMLNRGPGPPGQVQLGPGVKGAIGGVAAQPIPEVQHSVDLGAAEGKHMQIHAGVRAVEQPGFVPVRFADAQTITRRGHSGDVGGFRGRIRHREHQIKDRLGGEPRHRGGTDMFQELQAVPERGGDAGRLPHQEHRPLGIIVHDPDRTGCGRQLPGARRGWVGGRQGRRGRIRVHAALQIG